MTSDKTVHESRDLLCNWWISGAVFWFPALALIASGFFNIAQGWRAALWAAALTTMGVGCLANALRCGRVHCYLTGPFFLIMATVAILYGFGIVQLGTMGWNFIGLTVIAGLLVLYFLPEHFLGRYGR